MKKKKKKFAFSFYSHSVHLNGINNILLQQTTMNKLKGPLTIVTVIFLILFITYTSQIFVIWPYLGPANLHSVFILVPLNLFVAMVLINYVLTCRTNPGSVPNRWVKRSINSSKLILYSDLTESSIYNRCQGNKHLSK